VNTLTSHLKDGLRARALFIKSYYYTRISRTEKQNDTTVQLLRILVLWS